MIIEFSVANFRSIYEKVTLSMLASKLTGKEATQNNFFIPDKHPQLPILKSAVIYGANASGKTNLLKALGFFQQFVLNSTGLKHGEDLPYQPFRLFKNASFEPSFFELEFIASDNIQYIYSFSFNQKEILEEKLVSYNSKKPTEIFIRKKHQPIHFSSSFKGQKRFLEDQLQDNHLFLTKAANSNFSQVHSIYSFFLNKLSVVPSGNFKDLVSKIHSYLDPLFMKKIEDFLIKADTGINKLKTTKRDINLKILGSTSNIYKQYLIDENIYETKVSHLITDSDDPQFVEWPMDEESDGTKKLFAIAGPVINFLSNGVVLFLDELNNSLHPSVSEFIINLFNKEATNPKNAQLIFTTHDSSLLKKEIFRRDQIWFTEKNQSGMTQLYSLDSFDKKEVRSDIPFDKWYLSGRFGAIPFVQDFKMETDEVQK